MRCKIRFMLSFLLTVFVSLASCSGDEMQQEKVMYTGFEKISDFQWTKLSGMKIYFGHQSVGTNILEGVKDLMTKHPEINLNIVDTADINNFKEGIFAHSHVGSNTDPKSKINDFLNKIKQGIGESADAAGFKFCYIDIMNDTPVSEVFNNYKAMADEIQTQYPNLKIIHFTVPLVVKQTGIKAWIKKIIGKPVSGIDDNIKRNEYNALLLKEYQGKAPVFDIAEIESTYANGNRSTFEKLGMTYYSLVPEYTYDDGHLNQKGRRIVAEKFLVMLANL